MKKRNLPTEDDDEDATELQKNTKRSTGKDEDDEEDDDEADDEAEDFARRKKEQRTAGKGVGHISQAEAEKKDQSLLDRELEKTATAAKGFTSSASRLRSRGGQATPVSFGRCSGDFVGRASSEESEELCRAYLREGRSFQASQGARGECYNRGWSRGYHQHKTYFSAFKTVATKYEEVLLSDGLASSSSSSPLTSKKHAFRCMAVAKPGVLCWFQAWKDLRKTWFSSTTASMSQMLFSLSW